MKLIITIDTEEDDWGRYDPDGHSLKNIQRIPPLQSIFDELGFRPTYLLSYPVATDDGSISILKEMADGKRCEIGTHCHPWNTPPFNGIPESMICNLPADLQRKKISTLLASIRKRGNQDIRKRI